jgi:hypothetical protein
MTGQSSEPTVAILEGLASRIIAKEVPEVSDTNITIRLYLLRRIIDAVSSLSILSGFCHLTLLHC